MNSRTWMRSLKVLILPLSLFSISCCWVCGSFIEIFRNIWNWRKGRFLFLVWVSFTAHLSISFSWYGLSSRLGMASLATIPKLVHGPDNWSHKELAIALQRPFLVNAISAEPQSPTTKSNVSQGVWKRESRQLGGISPARSSWKACSRVNINFRGEIRSPILRRLFQWCPNERQWTYSYTEKGLKVLRVPAPTDCPPWDDEESRILMLQAREGQLQRSAPRRC